MSGHGRAHLPRVRGDDRRVDHRQRRRVADAHAADVRPHARRSAGTATKKTLDGAGDRRRSSTACSASTARRCGSSCGTAGSRAVIWVVCLGGHGLPVHGRPQGVPARRATARSSLGVLIAPGGRIARADARATRTAPSRSCTQNESVNMTVHDDRQRRSSSARTWASCSRSSKDPDERPPLKTLARRQADDRAPDDPRRLARTWPGR